MKILEADTSSIVQTSHLGKKAFFLSYKFIVFLLSHKLILPIQVQREQVFGTGSHN